MCVPPSGRATGSRRIDIVSERGRGRPREQATSATTAARKPLAGLTFFVKDMERHQADIGNFFLAEHSFLTDGGVTRRRVRSRPGYYGRSTRQR